MAIACMVDNPGVTREIYEKVRANVGLDAPAGGVLHLAGPGPDGGWRVLEIWESEDEAKQFFMGHIVPALQAAGVTGPPPVPEFWDVHTLMK